MVQKDMLNYIAIATLGTLMFILVGTMLVMKQRKVEQEMKDAKVGGDEKKVVRKRIGETDAYQEAVAEGKRTLNEGAKEEEKDKKKEEKEEEQVVVVDKKKAVDKKAD
jgi:hypothetical protein